MLKNDPTVLPTKFLKIILSCVLSDGSCKHFKAPALAEGFPPHTPFQLGNTTIKQKLSFIE